MHKPITETISENVTHPFDFVQPFDGSQPELRDAEKLEAAAICRGAIQDIFLANIDRVQRCNGAIALYPYDYSELYLDALSDDGAKVTAIVKSFDTEIGVPYELELHDDSEWNQAGRSMRYSLDPSGDEVRRADMHTEPLIISAKDKQRQPSSDITETFRKLGQILADGEKGKALERQLGLNDQPVGPAEMRQVAEIVRAAKPR